MCIGSVILIVLAIRCWAQIVASGHGRMSSAFVLWIFDVTPELPWSAGAAQEMF